MYIILYLYGFAWLTRNISAVTLYQRLKSDSEFKNQVIFYICLIVRETVDLSLGQQFQSETLGTTPFNML